MKNCKQCHRRLRSDYQLDICKLCLAVCECGAKKDYRAKQCRSCGSRTGAIKQWQKIRPKMEASLRAFAATRKGKPIKPPRVCSIDGCGQPYEARGWCHKHYARWKFRRTPHLSTKLSPEEKFWANVEKTEKCWIWRGITNENGYGLIRINGKYIRAHRYSYFLAYGEYPMPMGRHTCDNPPCVNPGHIVPGTQQENVQDRVDRNRQPRGSKVGGSKLTELDVIEIKMLLKAKIFHRIIAEKFGVHKLTIGEINTGKTWKHVL